MSNSIQVTGATRHTTVSRGLLATQDSGRAVVSRKTVEERVQAKITKLRGSCMGHFNWREAMDEFKLLSNGGTAGFSGRRLLTEEAREKARYLARVARKAARTEEVVREISPEDQARGVTFWGGITKTTTSPSLPEEGQWPRIAGALRVVYEDLYGEGR